MGGVCCGPDAMSCDNPSQTPRPEGFETSQDIESLPKAPKATSRILGQEKQSAVKDPLAELVHSQNMLSLVLRLQAHFRRRKAKQRVDEIKETTVVQHYTDPAMANVSLENLTLLKAPNRMKDDEPSPRTLARQLASNNKPGWLR
mmetsp:Transcript_95599/g.169762  ORF Transcript_95599/g.169762 Transcript_95599/m.169762 type:complete len:145 (+) Transcript_95599:73-507(+)